MDLPGCDPDRLDRTYAQFALVNRAVSGWRGIYRQPTPAPAVRRALRPPPAGHRLRGRRRAGDAGPLGCPGRAAPARSPPLIRIRGPACSPAGRHASRGVAFRRQQPRSWLEEGPPLRRGGVQPRAAPPRRAGEHSWPSRPGCRRGTVIHNDIRRSAAAYALFFASLLGVHRLLHPGGRADLHPAQLHRRGAGRGRSPGLDGGPPRPVPEPAAARHRERYPDGPPPVADVLIIGGGPVGLFMAALLLQDGVDVQVLEQRTAPEAHSRAIGIHPPALAALARDGVAEAWLRRASRSAGESPWPAGGLLAEMSFAGVSDRFPIRPFLAPGAHCGAAGTARQ